MWLAITFVRSPACKKISDKYQNYEKNLDNILKQI